MNARETVKKNWDPVVSRQRMLSSKKISMLSSMTSYCRRLENASTTSTFNSEWSIVCSESRHTACLKKVMDAKKVVTYDISMNNMYGGAPTR